MSYSLILRSSQMFQSWYRLKAGLRIQMPKPKPESTIFQLVMYHQLEMIYHF